VGDIKRFHVNIKLSLWQMRRKRSNIKHNEDERPPLWASGQSSWLKIQRSGSITGATRFSEK
jgi:hypothetical protein